MFRQFYLLLSPESKEIAYRVYVNRPVIIFYVLIVNNNNNNNNNMY